MKFNIRMMLKRISWIDYGKCFCMLMVILSHTWTLFAKDSNIFLDLMKPTRLLVFFFISGYLIKLESFDFKKNLLSICKKLLFPYFCFTLIIWIPKHLANGEGFSLYAMLIDILGGYASWFVAALAVSKIILALILSITRRLKIIWILCILLTILGLLLTNYINITVPWNANKGLIALVYLAAGITYKRYEVVLSFNIKLQAFLSVIIYFLFVSLDYFLLHQSTYLFNLDYGEVTLAGVSSFMFLSILGIWMTVNVVKILPIGIKWLTYIGKNSLIYYYLNTGLLTVLIMLLAKAGIFYDGNDWITFTLFLITVLLLGIISKFILRYFPWMVGNFTKQIK